MIKCPKPNTTILRTSKSSSKPGASANSPESLASQSAASTLIFIIISDAVPLNSVISKEPEHIMFKSSDIKSGSATGTES